MKNSFRLSKVLILASFNFLFVNCSKDSTSDNEVIDLIPTYGEPIKDIDGNVYTTVIIGNQTWMAENLRTTRYNNGDSIPNIKDGELWSNQTSGARCSYENKSENSKAYGELYNWFALVDNRDLAPKGWHVSTYEDWNTLFEYVRTHVSKENMMTRALASSTTDWLPYKSYYPWMDEQVLSNNIASNNSSGFTGLPGGFRDNDGKYSGQGIAGFWWSSTAWRLDNAWAMDIDVSGQSGRGSMYFECGMSVRCVKDSN